MAKYYSEHYAGENSPTWKGGKNTIQGNGLMQGIMQENVINLHAKDVG